MFTLFQMGLQIHGEQWRAVGVVGTANRSVVTAHFMISATDNTASVLFLCMTMSQQQKSQANTAKGNGPVYSLPGAEFDGERTAKWVNLKGTGLA